MAGASLAVSGVIPSRAIVVSIRHTAVSIPQTAVSAAGCSFMRRFFTGSGPAHSQHVSWSTDPGKCLLHPAAKGAPDLWLMNQRMQLRSATTFPKRPGDGLPAEADVVIVGGGVTGSALFYSLADFTDLEKIVLLERRDVLAEVSSGPNNNSQTIHCGDIETNYTPDKAASVQRVAHMLRNFATKLPQQERDRCIVKMQKMAIGVGDVECGFMEKRFHEFKPVFKNLQLLNKDEIARIEPAVAYSNPRTRQLRPEPIVANYVENEHSAINYFHLVSSLVRKAIDIGNNSRNRDIRALMSTEMGNITKLPNGLWRMYTSKGPIDAKYVVVSACGYSLLIAHQLGFAHHMSCLPVAGSFYFGPKVLNGKVYMVQNPLLPFAALHGDPDLVAGLRTRFGPTAVMLPLLERYRWSSLWDFLRVLRPSPGLLKVYLDLFGQKTIRNYVFKNFMFEVPILNKKLFVQDARKIVPSLGLADIQYAHGFGGVRPQIIDKRQRKLLLGEGKIQPADENIVFNVTPSPGGTTCLGNAETDLRRIVNRLGCGFDRMKLSKVLLEGEYPVEEVAIQES